MYSRPIPSCSASAPATCRLELRLRCSCCRSWRSRRYSSCAACASAEGKSDEHLDPCRAVKPKRSRPRQPEKQPPLGTLHLLFLPGDIRDLLPSTAVLHGGHVAQERCRGRANGDQSVDHR